ncbi:unnamed protein product, partial [Prorocentrum cordatum]
GHKFGPPHVYIWMGLVQALIDRGAAVGQNTLGELQQCKTTWDGLTFEEIAETVRFCRQGKIYDPKHKRIAFSLTDLGVRQTVIAAMRQMGEVMASRVFPGHMEREAQEWLEKFIEK